MEFLRGQSSGECGNDRGTDVFLLKKNVKKVVIQPVIERNFCYRFFSNMKFLLFDKKHLAECKRSMILE